MVPGLYLSGAACITNIRVTGGLSLVVGDGRAFTADRWGGPSFGAGPAGVGHAFACGHEPWPF